MKKMLGVVVLGLAVSGTAQAGMKYECWTYLGGSPSKMTYVVADNNAQAVQLAVVKFRDLGAKSDYIKCK